MLKKYFFISVLLSSLLFASSIEISDGYARTSPPTITNSAAFLKISNNTNSDIKLIGAKSSISKYTEIHAHSMEGGVMRMYQVKGIDIEKKSSVTLMPGGYHIMFIGLKNPLKEGQKIDLELNFSNNSKIRVVLPVKRISSMGMHHNMKH
jgi:copper(I)-binding protein